MKTFALLVFLFSATVFANAKKVCLMNQETIMKDVEQCMAHNLGLALSISEHMSNPASMESPDFLCKYKSDLADLFECMVHKLADCVPEKSDVLLSLLPSKKRLLQAFDFICDHRDEMNNKCFKDMVTPFMQCYMGKVQMLSSSGLAGTSDPKKILCSVVRSEEACIEQNKGTCSSKFISYVKQVLEMVFPIKDCPKALAIDSILLRGEPLIFKPMNKNRGYAIHP